MKPASIIHVGDVRTELAKLEAGSVQCCVTSPPYWGLRDYGTGTWSGGDAGCDHEITRGRPRPELGGDCTSWSHRDVTGPASNACSRCGAKRTDLQIGSEPTIDEFIETLVEVFRGVKRVLRDDGTLWVNMGDAMVSQGGERVYGSSDGATGRGDAPGRRVAVEALPPKNLIGQPWRLAFALQADGWILRSDIIWHKPNPMPESCTDRPAKSHEYVFLLTKQPRYYYDAEAVREPHSEPWRSTGKRCGTKDERPEAGVRSGTMTNIDRDGGREYNPAGRNLRTVWSIPTQSFAGCHFATFPERLVEPCLKAGTSAKGCCPECGAAWVRVVERDRVATRPGLDNVNDETGMANRDNGRHVTETRTTGWAHGCECFNPDQVCPIGGNPDNYQFVSPPIPCTVLDCFSGAGTVGVVAKKLGLSYVGIELNPEYAEMSRRRIANPDAKQPVPDVPGQLQMFSERMDTDG